MEYSAVNQPIDLPSRNGGTVSDTLAVTRTAVSPERYSTLPALLRTNPRSIVTGRSWSFFRRCDRVIGNLDLCVGETAAQTKPFHRPGARPGAPFGNGA